MMLIAALLIFSLLPRFNCKNYDYYWKDYYGDITDDAVPGGFDRNGKYTYIAQVYIPGHGIFPTRIYQGKTEVTASRHGVHTSDVFIKMLCSNQPKKLLWVPTTSSRIHLDSRGKHLVVGGTENGKILNIGRMAYKGEVIVGKVCTYDSDAGLYFPYGDEEVGSDTYEVLIYNDTTSGFCGTSSLNSNR